MVIGRSTSAAPVRALCDTFGHSRARHVHREQRRPQRQNGCDGIESIESTATVAVQIDDSRPLQGLGGAGVRLWLLRLPFYRLPVTATELETALVHELSLS